MRSVYCSLGLKGPGTEGVRFFQSVNQDHVLGIYASSKVGVEPVTVKSCPALLKKIEKGNFMLEDLNEVSWSIVRKIFRFIQTQY
jgi:hypothetical protein